MAVLHRDIYKIDGCRDVSRGKLGSCPMGRGVVAIPVPFFLFFEVALHICAQEVSQGEGTLEAAGRLLPYAKPGLKPLIRCGLGGSAISCTRSVSVK